MRLITKEDTFNIGGFDVPALDRWRMSLTLELDLLTLKERDRLKLMETVDALYKGEFDRFFRDLRGNKIRKSPSKTTDVKAMLNSLLLTQKIDIFYRGMPWGGEANLEHNKLAKRFGTVEKLLKSKPEAMDKLIIGYVDDPVHSIEDKLVSGKIIPVTIPEIDISEISDDFSIKGTTDYEILYEDDDVRLHNQLIEAKTDSKIKIDKKLESKIGIGIFPNYSGKKIEPDGFLRKIMWRASLAVLSSDDVILKDDIPPVLLKRDTDNRPLKDVYSSARTEYRILFSNISGITKVLDSEYYIPEVYVLVDKVKHPKGIETPDGFSDRVILGKAFRPNKMIFGITEDEKRHNDMVKSSKGDIGSIYLYYDAEKKKILRNIVTASEIKFTVNRIDPKAIFKTIYREDTVIRIYVEKLPSKTIKEKELSVEGKILKALKKLEGYFTYEFVKYSAKAVKEEKGKFFRQMWKTIPVHGIDIYDVKLSEEESKHNLDVMGGGKGTMEKYSGKIIDLAADHREALSKRHWIDWRFEEVLYGIYKPLLKATLKFMTDERTGKFFWKFNEYWNTVSEDLSEKIKTVDIRPASNLAVKNVHKMLESSFFLPSGATRFEDFLIKEIEPHYDKIFERIPELALDVVKNLGGSALLKARAEKFIKEKDRDIYTKANYESLDKKIKDLINSYLHDIAVYPFAEVSVERKSEKADFYYTTPFTKDYLLSFGLGEENDQLRNDRKNIEFFLRFLEIALEKLQSDIVKVEAERKYIMTAKSVKKEEAEGESEEKRTRISRVMKKSLTEKQKTRLKETLDEIFSEPPPYTKALHDLVKRMTRLNYRWGYENLEHYESGRGDIVFYLADMLEHLNGMVKKPKLKKFAEPLIEYFPMMRNLRSTSDPVDLLYVFEVKDVKMGEDFKELIEFYYDPEIIKAKVDKDYKGITAILVYKDIEFLIKERMSKFFLEKEETMKDFLDKDFSKTKLKELVFDNFSEKVTDKQIRGYLGDLISEYEKTISKAETKKEEAEKKEKSLEEKIKL